MKSTDSTHHCWSPTPTLNGCDLTPSIETQSSEQEYSYLTVSMRHPSTQYSRNTPQSFSQGTWAEYIPEFDKTCEGLYVFGMLPGFFENLLESRNLFCCASTVMQWVSSSFGSIVFAISWHTLVL